MVKRPKTPDHDEDEKYFTVYQPYPLNANWELPTDYIAFSQWIASCIGTEPLHALHYKPKARGMVLLEIDKKYPHNERLLGEHRWAEFLKKPTEEEIGRVTQIFHCLYKTGREAQKDGWKRIHVESVWFKDWSPTDNPVKNPYPTTYWCPTPPEDRTNKPLCRPLPVKDKPPPEVPPPPVVVGSEGWISAKTGPQDTPGSLKGAWAAKVKKKGQPVKVNTANSQQMGRPSPSPASAITPINAWNKPIAPISASATRPSQGPASSNPPNSWNKPITQKQPVHDTSPSSPTKVQTPAHPPGLGPSRKDYPTPPGLVNRQDSDNTTSGSGESLEVDNTVKALDELFEDKVTIALSPSQDCELYGLVDETSPEITAESVIQPWEAGYIPEDYDLWGDTDAAPPVQGNLWGEESAGVKKPTVVLCPHHQHLCKKGVCSWRAKQVKEEERLQELAKKIDNRAGGKSQGKSVKGGNGRRR